MDKSNDESKSSIVRYIGIVPPRKACGKIPACKGQGVIFTRDFEKYAQAKDKPKIERHSLESMDDVRLFIRGIFSSKWRKPEPSESITSKPLHSKFRDRKKDETDESFSLHHPSQLVYSPKRIGGVMTRVVTGILDSVACEFSGVQPGDFAASFLGSTGGLVLAGLIHRIPEGVKVRAMTVFTFQKIFGDIHAEEDRAYAIATLLAERGGADYDLIHPVQPTDLAFISMSSLYDQFIATQRDRIAQGNRVYSAAKAKTFLDAELFASDFSIEAMGEIAMEEDPVHRGLLEEEARLKKVVEKHLKEIPIYVALRKRVRGAAVSILAPIIAETIHIGRFPAMAAARKYWGTGLFEGKFMRKTAGRELGYNPVCRQAFYQFGQQIIKGGAEEFWVKRYGLNVGMYKARHPHPVFVELKRGGNSDKESNGKTWVETGRRFDAIPGQFKEIKEKGKITLRIFVDPADPAKEIRVEKGFFLFNPGHLLKMALWRTLTEFADWLYWFWRTEEDLETRPPKAFPPEDGDAVAKTASAWFANHPPKVPKGYRPSGSAVQVSDLIETSPSQ